MSGRSSALVFASSVLSVFVPAAHADDIPRVGIVVTSYARADLDRSASISEAMAKALRDKLRVDVIAGAEAARRLPPEGVPDVCVAEPACQVDAARRLDADELLMLTIVRVGSVTKIDITWIDVRDGKSASRPAITLGPDDDIKQVMHDAATVLLPAAERRPVAKDTPATPTVITPPTIVHPRIVRTPRHMTLSAWISAGITGAGLAGGAAFAWLTRSKFRDLENTCGKTASCSGAQLDSVDRRALTADVLLGVGVVAGVMTAVFYLTSDSETELPPQPTGPVVTATGDGLGVGFTGTF